MKTSHFFMGIVGMMVLITLMVKAPFASLCALENNGTAAESIEKLTGVDDEASTTEKIVLTTSSSPEAIEETVTTPAKAEEVLPTYTEATLAEYDGENADLPIYIAFDGDVYDVTAGKEFYQPGGKYHFLAGTDGTKLLKMFGGDLIKKKYPVVGTFR